MILAAGRGERMRPLTDHTPKTLLKVAGKPLIVWHIERLVLAGICDLVINPCPSRPADRKRAGRWFAVGRASATRAKARGGRSIPAAGFSCTAAARWCPFLVVNADVWCDLDPRQLNLGAGDLVQLVMVDNPPQHPAGDFHLCRRPFCPPPPSRG